jgi:hypothetical protein
LRTEALFTNELGMRLSLLAACAAAGVVVLGVGIYRAYTAGQFMPMVLGALILMSCAANFLKRQGNGKDGSGKPEGEDRTR